MGYFLNLQKNDDTLNFSVLVGINVISLSFGKFSLSDPLLFIFCNGNPRRSDTTLLISTK